MSPSTITPHAPDLRGHALDGRYELLELIGEGSFGRVYRGHDRRLARPVAIKVIKPWWSEDPEWVRRFEREAQLMARVSAPGIVQIFDVGHAEEGLYYVAELVDGESLEHRLRRGRLAPSQASEVAEKLCRALAHAHAQRVVHGDIKPANVLISARGTVKVGDFGVARLAAGSSVGPAGTIAGTPRYMAPEQARGRGTTAASDVYSVGVVLYEMLAGRPPFTGGSPVDLALRHLHDAPPPLGPAVTADLAGVVDRALAKEPGERYANAAEMSSALVGARDSILPRIPVRRRPDAAVRAGEDADPKPPRGDEDGTDATCLREDAAGATRRRESATRIAPALSPRRNMNPAARRRSIALLAAVIAVVFGMIAAAVVIGGVGHVRVPDLHGLSRRAVAGRARRTHLKTEFAHKYSSAPRGTAIDQSPASGTRVRENSTVRITLSDGPPPVALPQLVGMSAPGAQAELMRLRLRASVSQVPAPGIAAGQVTRQSPSTGTKVFPNSTVALSVAETPRWRALTTLTGNTSVPFRIRGTRWRLVYRMSYEGTCTLIFICSGPTAHAANLSRATITGSFDLNEGSGQIWTFASGPGLYQVRISPGSDTATWSAQVQDYY
jgi:eukaryotic-like serine/threonine-protein kinase